MDPEDRHNFGMSVPVHRPIVGIESLSLQGWPALGEEWQFLVDRFPSDALHQSLAGNAFPGTVVLALVAALLFAADGSDGWTQALHSDRHATRDALAAFGRASAAMDA